MFRVLKAADGEDGRAWAQALRARDVEHKQLLKSDSVCAVWRMRMRGRDVVVKAWADPRNRWKSWFRVSRGYRQWAGAAILRDLGIPIAKPLALLRWGFLENLLMEWLEGPTLLELMARRGGRVRDEHALAAAVGGQVSAFGDWFNRDHKPSNLIVLGDRGNLSLAVIDTVAIRRARPDSHARMLASLVIEPAGCECPPRLALRMRALTAYLAVRGVTGKQARNDLWRRVEAIVRGHGDPTPKINPLADAKKGIQA